VNRIRAWSCDEKTIVATWSNQVNIYDVSRIADFEQKSTPTENPLIFSTHKHSAEGYGMDWSKIDNRGRLLTGDQNGQILPD